MSKAQPPHPIPMSGAAGREHSAVLLVDDAPEVRLGLRALLEQRLGAAVIEAASNMEAFAAAKRHKFDLVITDYSRPGGDGLTFLHEFKARYPQTPVVLHTAQAARIRHRARKLGAAACLQKMMTLPRLKIIERVLSAHR